MSVLSGGASTSDEISACINAQEDEKEDLLNHIVLEELMDGLEKTEQRIIQMRYYENKTQTEIAGEIGISQVQVSRLEKKILKKMRERYQSGI